jgi:hypothetical protein
MSTATGLIALIVTFAAPSPAAEPPSQRPNLIVMISVDMLSGEIMDRYGAGLPGGLGRLEKEGVFFENAFQEHAFTETGPGHSVLLSGRHPASTGIPANQWRDRATGEMIYCVQDSSAVDFGEPSGKAGSSGGRFKGTTFGNWLKDQLPGSRVFSIAGKDRAAILMAGPKADGVYWFQDGFGFTTSTAYAKKLPGWLTQFNETLDGSGQWTHLSRPLDGREHVGGESIASSDPNSRVGDAGQRRLLIKRDSGWKLLEKMVGVAILR